MKEEGLPITGGLGTCRGDEYILPAPAGFAIRFQFQPAGY